MKKIDGHLEDIFMQTGLLEQIKMPNPHTTGNKKWINHWKELLNREGEGMGSIPQTK